MAKKTKRNSIGIMPQNTGFDFKTRASLKYGDQMGLLKIPWTKNENHFHCWLDINKSRGMNTELKKRFKMHTKFDYTPEHFSYDFNPDIKVRDHEGD